jgi:hypothetical protein
MTTDEAGLLIATLAAAYPRQQLEPATIEVYTRSLADLDHDLASAAVTALIASSVFFPTVAEIRSQAAELATGLPTATEAWIMVTTHPDYRPAMTAEVKEALNAVGGSWAVRTSENPETLRAQFRRAYEEIRQRKLDTVVLAAVPALEHRRPPELAA